MVIYANDFYKPTNTNNANNSGKDGATFKKIYEMGIAVTSKELMNFNYQGERPNTQTGSIEWCYKLEDFKYTNYTVPSKINGEDIKSYDISYSQFWNKNIAKLKEVNPDYDENSDYSHYALYNNDAGDFSNGKTKIRYGLYNGETERKNKIVAYGEFNEMYEGNNVIYNACILDGRIVTALPVHLLLKPNEDLLKELYENQMHKYENYDHTDGGRGSFLRKANDNTLKINDTIYANKLYSLVDVVMESSEGYQYVIPFTVVDVKWIHHKPSDEHYAMFTDNTYGHVYQSIVNSSDGSESILKYNYMNPMEPYIQVKYNGRECEPKDDLTMLPLPGDMNEVVTKYLFGKVDTEDKVVSMRIYPDVKFDENNSDWWTRINNRFKRITIEAYKREIDQHKINGMVVDFGKRYN